MRERVLFFCAAVCLIAGAVLLMSAALQTPAEGPTKPPLPQTTSGEPAWTHRCLGTDDDPPECP